MTSKLLVLLGGAILIGVLGQADSSTVSSGSPEPAYDFAQEPPAAAPAPDTESSGDGAASLLMLGAFLGLIGVNLVRWSGDDSCKSKRSVF